MTTFPLQSTPSGTRSEVTPTLAPVLAPGLGSCFPDSVAGSVKSSGLGPSCLTQLLRLESRFPDSVAVFLGPVLTTELGLIHPSNLDIVIGSSWVSFLPPSFVFPNPIQWKSPQLH